MFTPLAITHGRGAPWRGKKQRPHIRTGLHGEMLGKEDSSRGSMAERRCAWISETTVAGGVYLSKALTRAGWSTTGDGVVKLRGARHGRCETVARGRTGVASGEQLDRLCRRCKRCR